MPDLRSRLGKPLAALLAVGSLAVAVPATVSAFDSESGSGSGSTQNAPSAPARTVQDEDRGAQRDDGRDCPEKNGSSPDDAAAQTAAPQV